VFKTLLVAKREFLATVLTKAFLLGILLPPAIGAIGLTLVPMLMSAASPKTVGTIAVIDRTGEVQAALKESLRPDAFRERAGKRVERAGKIVKDRVGTVASDPRSEAAAKSIIAAGAPTLDVLILPGDASVEAEKKPLLDARVRDAEGASQSQRVALVVIPEGAVRQPAGSSSPSTPATDKPAEFDHYQLFTAPKLDIEVRGEISSEVDKAIVDARLRLAGMDPGRTRSLIADPQTDSKVVTAEGEQADSGAASMLLPVAFLFLLWMSVLVGGQGLLMSTIEEKSSRVMEVLLSAVSPIQLMVGKIIGQMAVASLILGLYSFTGVAALIFFSMKHLLDPMVLVYTGIYFVIAFFLMASMMAAVGSVVNDIREAQTLMQPIMLVMVVPMVLWLPISRNPNGAFAQITSFIPPISPFVMVVRLAGSEAIPVWQIPVSIAIGVAAMVFMAWATAKIFRIGVLMYGKPPNMKTLIRWVRMA
jgi:ABC-2 type transport system permease protein